MAGSWEEFDAAESGEAAPTSDWDTFDKGVETSSAASNLAKHRWSLMSPRPEGTYEVPIAPPGQPKMGQVAKGRLKELAFTTAMGQAPTPQGRKQFQGAAVPHIGDAAALAASAGEFETNPQAEREKLAELRPELFSEQARTPNYVGPSESPLEAGALAAGASAVPTATGLVGAAQGMKVPGPWPVKLGGALVGGATGGIIGNIAQNMVLPEEFQQILELNRQAHPKATFAGELAPSALAIRPSVRNLYEVARLTKQAATPAGRAALAADPNRVARISNLFNVGLGSAIEGGMEGGRQIVDRKFEPKRLVAAFASGALMSEPTAIGKRLGFRSDWEMFDNGSAHPPAMPPPAAVEALIRRGEFPQEAIPYQMTAFEQGLEALRETMREGGAPAKAGVGTARGGKVSPGKGPTFSEASHSTQAILAEAQLAYPDLTRKEVKAKFQADKESVLREIAWQRAKRQVEAIGRGEQTAYNPDLPLDTPAGAFPTERLNDIRKARETVERYHMERARRKAVEASVEAAQVQAAETGQPVDVQAVVRQTEADLAGTAPEPSPLNRDGHVEFDEETGGYKLVKGPERGTIVGSLLGGLQDKLFPEQPAKKYDPRFEGFFKDEVPETFTSKGVTFTLAGEQANHKGEIRTRYWKADRELPFTGGGPNSRIPESQLAREGYTPDVDPAIAALQERNAVEQLRENTDLRARNMDLRNQTRSVERALDPHGAADDVGAPERRQPGRTRDDQLTPAALKELRAMRRGEPVKEPTAPPVDRSTGQRREYAPVSTPEERAGYRGIGQEEDIVAEAQARTRMRGEDTGPVVGSLLGGLQPHIQALVNNLKQRMSVSNPTRGQSGLERIAREEALKMWQAQGKRKRAVTNAGAWATNVMARALRELGRQPTVEEVKALWPSKSVRLARLGHNPFEVAGQANPRGLAKAYGDEIGDPELGLAIFNTMKRREASAHLIRRLTRERNEDVFKPVGKQAEQDMYFALAAQPEAGQHGAWLRADTMTIDEVNAYLAQSGGSRVIQGIPGYADGLIIGPPMYTKVGKGKNAKYLPPTEVQLYRLIDPQDSAAIDTAFRTKYPEAIPAYEKLLSIQREAQELDALGDRLPFIGLSNLKRQYKVDGLNEAAILNHIAAREGLNVGPGGVQMAYVPDVAGHSRTFLGYYRNFLNRITAGARKHKTGATSEAIRRGEAKPLLKKGVQKAQEGLAVEEIHNEMITDFLVAALSPIENGQLKPGHERFDARLFAGDRFKQFLKQFTPVAQQAGIALTPADFAAAGERVGYQIPTGLKQLLAPAFTKEVVSSNARKASVQDAAYKIADTAVSTINTAWITGLYTQIGQPLVANNIMMGTRFLRDAFRPLFEAIAPTSEFGRMASVQNALNRIMSDVKAPVNAFKKSRRLATPAEVFGESSVADVTGTVPSVKKIQSATLTPMRLNDLATKRINDEASMDFAAQLAYLDAKRSGTLPPNTSRADFVRQYRENVPPEVEALGRLENDTYGGFDFSNINQAMGALRGLGANGRITRWFGLAGRATLPFPIFVYKLFNNFYREGAEAAYRVARPRNREEWVRAASTLAAYTTMHALAYKWYTRNRPDDHLPEEEVAPGLTAPATTDRDIPYHLRKVGRVGVPLRDRTAWINVAQQPILGDIAMVEGLKRGDLSMEDYMEGKLGLGILPHAVMTAQGIGTKFNESMPPGAKWGDFVGKAMPFSTEMFLMRRKFDPVRRSVSEPGDSWSRAFARGFANRYPVLSELLEPLPLGRDKKLKMYAPDELTLSQIWGNTIFTNEQDRATAIAAARVATLTKLKQDMDEDEAFRIAETMVDAAGNTPMTDLARAIRAEQVKKSAYNLLLGIKMSQAFRSTLDVDAGSKAAEDIADKFIDGVDEKYQDALDKRVKAIIDKLIDEREVDPFVLMYDTAPPEVQDQFEQQMLQREMGVGNGATQQQAGSPR